MPTSAWVMAIVIGIILYGGLGVCIRIAVRKSKEQKSEE
jgi:hypothetical protein